MMRRGYRNRIRILESVSRHEADDCLPVGDLPVPTRPKRCGERRCPGWLTVDSFFRKQHPLRFENLVIADRVPTASVVSHPSKGERCIDVEWYGEPADPRGALDWGYGI